MRGLIVIICIFLLTIHSNHARNTGYSISTDHADELLRSGDSRTLRDLSFSFLNNNDFNRSVIYSQRLTSLGEATGNDTLRLYAAICFAQSYMMLGDTIKSRKYMDLSLDLATMLEDNSALASVYNGLGLYASNVQTNIYLALDYYFLGLEAAKVSGNERLYSILLANISDVYSLKNDPAGLLYSEECYERGHTMNDPFLIYAGATSAAHMYYIGGDYEAAERYIQEAEFIREKNDIYDQSRVYYLYGDILYAMGNKSSAEEYYGKALETSSHAHASSIAGTYMGISRIREDDGKYAEAVELLNTGLMYATGMNNKTFTSRIYQRLSDNYAGLGDYASSLSYFKKYHEAAEELFNTEKERSMNELSVRYDLERHENQTRLAQIRALRSERRGIILGFSLLVLLVVLFLTAIMYRRKNKLYTELVRQGQKAFQKESRLKSDLITLSRSAEASDPAKYSASSLTEEKSAGLFWQLERLMQEEKVYKENFLTKEKVAEVLGTNRTYLSRAINEHTGLTFTQYINNARIEEAIRIISEQEDVVLKGIARDLGFSSLTTFYKSFQQHTGVTPSVYKEKAALLRKKGSGQKPAASSAKLT